MRSSILDVFIGRTNAETKASILGPPDSKTHWKKPGCSERLKAKGEGRGRR